MRLAMWLRSMSLGLVRTIIGFTLLRALSRCVLPSCCQAGNVFSSFYSGRKCGSGSPVLWHRSLSLAQAAGMTPNPSTTQPACFLEWTVGIAAPIRTLCSAGLGRSRQLPTDVRKQARGG